MTMVSEVNDEPVLTSFILMMWMKVDRYQSHLVLAGIILLS